MIALCPTHHTSLGEMHPSKCYALKKNPYNLRKGFLRGMLGTNKNFSAFDIGGNTFINTPTILEYYGKPIIQYKVFRKQVLLSAYIPEKDFWPSLEIVENEVTVNRKQAWDIVFRTNLLKLVRLDKSFFEIDLRKDEAKISGKIEIGGQTFEFTPKYMNIPSFTAQQCTFKNLSTALSIGDGNHTVHWPNFAMATPRPIFTRI